jgi:hypothetical protein
MRSLAAGTESSKWRPSLFPQPFDSFPKTSTIFRIFVSPESREISLGQMVYVVEILS